jgi:hypothetical protein
VGISLKIEITSPMDERDHELLSGIAVMTLAIANHELARAKFPEAFTDEETPAPEEPTDEEPTAPVKLCGVIAPPPDGDMICVSEVGPSGLHKGRHKFRQIPDARVGILEN